MNRCQGCSAPLQPFKSRCEYCGTVNDIDRDVLKASGAEAESKLHCPVCHVLMKTLNLGGAGDRIILADKCGTCFGLFFGHGKLEAILENLAAFDFLLDTKRLDDLCGSAVADTPVAYRHCPVCGKLMNRVNFGARSGVITDQCFGHGVWLHAGDLKRLVEWRNAGGDLHDEEMRREIERERLRREKGLKERLDRLKREADASGRD
jgi:Zn-finger nucleic acid-binding protein